MSVFSASFQGGLTGCGVATFTFTPKSSFCSTPTTAPARHACHCLNRDRTGGSYKLRRQGSESVEKDRAKSTRDASNIMNDLILYTTEDGKNRIKLRAKDQTVWLSQREMAQLFDVSTDNAGLHLKSIFEDAELSREATTEESSVVQTEGGRQIQRTLTLYNRDAILAVGYRVRSPRGVQFRRWASTILKEYLLKGFVMDYERLKNPDGRPDYFDEMLERIRDIRASEKRFYHLFKSAWHLFQHLFQKRA